MAQYFSLYSWLLSTNGWKNIYNVNPGPGVSKLRLISSVNSRKDVSKLISIVNPGADVSKQIYIFNLITDVSKQISNVNSRSGLLRLISSVNSRTISQRSFLSP